MGADGHIQIYDFEILESILGKDNIHTSATVYVHTIFGKKVVTEYWGDNLLITNCLVCGKHGHDHEDDGSLGAYHNSEQEAHDKLIEPATIASDWEVWT